MGIPGSLNGTRSNRHGLLLTFFLGASVSLCLILGLFMILGIVPWGSTSLVADDAAIQYVHLYRYLHDCLLGRNSIIFTFSNQLGTSGIGIFAYYLASPINWLVLCFDKTQMHTFYDIAVALKLALASGFACVFLSWRFDGERRALPISLLLGISYGLSSACISQARNLLWLDGYYMLPLMLLAVSYLVRREVGYPFALAVGVSLVFSWYTGFINGLWCVLWFCYETWSWAFVPTKQHSPRRTIARFLLWSLVGIALSSILLVPTAIQMSNASATELLGGRLFVAPPGGFKRLFSSLAQSSLWGSNEHGYLYLWLGPTAMVGCACALFGDQDARIRKANLVLSLAVIAPLLIMPLDRVFSLFKFAASYWPRYNYGLVLMLLTIASTWLFPFFTHHMEWGNVKAKLCHERSWSLAKSYAGLKSGCYALLAYLSLAVIVWVVSPKVEIENIIVSALCIFGCVAIMTAMVKAKWHSNLRGFRLLGFAWGGLLHSR